MNESIQKEITDTPINPEGLKYTVEKIPSDNGFIYDIYFASQEEAEKAVTEFWNTRESSESTIRGLESGMLKPFKHEITGGDRTSPGKGYKYTNLPFRVQFNGNTKSLSPKGELALHKLGFI